MPSTTLSVLTFDDAFAELRNFVKTQTDLTDYNSDGSGVSVLTKILASHHYRTSLLSKLMANESSAASAVTRSGLIARAVDNNIQVPGAKASTVSLRFEMTINSASSSITANTVTLPVGTKIKSSNSSSDSRVFSLMTNAVLTMDSDNGGTKTFSGTFLAYEGSINTYNFVVDGSVDNQRFIMQPIKHDVAFLTVDVYNDISMNTYKTSLTNVYDSQGGNDGVLLDGWPYFKVICYDDSTTEFIFPDSELSSGNVISVTYFSTSGSSGNGASGMSTVSNHQIEPTDIISYSVTVENGFSFGGSDSPTVDEIREIIVNHRPTQNRIVTLNDAKNVLVKLYPSMNRTSVWSGAEEVPVKFGKIFISSTSGIVDAFSTINENSISKRLTANATDGTDVVFKSPALINVFADISVSFDKGHSGLYSNLDSDITAQAIAIIKDSYGFNMSIDNSAVVSKLKSMYKGIVDVAFSYSFSTKMTSYNVDLFNKIESVTVEDLLYTGKRIKLIGVDGDLIAYYGSDVLFNGEPVGKYSNTYVSVYNAFITIDEQTTVNFKINNTTPRVKKNGLFKLSELNVDVSYV